MSGIDALRATFAKELARFDKESQKHKGIYRRSQLLIIGLTTFSTVVAAAGLVLPSGYDKAVQFAVVCLTATTAAVASWTEMRRARELWQHEREVYYGLLDIERGFEFIASTGDVTQETLQATYQRVTAVLGSSSQKWARIQEKKEP